jgi:hypothetical protein
MFDVLCVCVCVCECMYVLLCSACACVCVCARVHVCVVPLQPTQQQRTAKSLSDILALKSRPEPVDDKPEKLNIKPVCSCTILSLRHNQQSVHVSLEQWMDSFANVSIPLHRVPQPVGQSAV